MFRRLKAGSIEPHPSEKAIILNYKLEATVFGDPGDPMLEESKVRFALLLIFHIINSLHSPPLYFVYSSYRSDTAPGNFQKILNVRLLFTELSKNHTPKISELEN